MSIYIYIDIYIYIYIYILRERERVRERERDIESDRERGREIEWAMCGAVEGAFIAIFCGAIALMVREIKIVLYVCTHVYLCRICICIYTFIYVYIYSRIYILVYIVRARVSGRRPCMHLLRRHLTHGP